MIKRHSCHYHAGIALAVTFSIAITSQAGACSVPVSKATAVALEACHRQAVLRDIEKKIDAHYVFVERRASVIGTLKSAEHDGHYNVSDPVQFAERVTNHLQAASPDGHLYLKYSPDEYAAMRAPPSSDAGLDSYRRLQALRLNHGLTDMRILPANIRYLKITGFKWVPDGSTARAYDAAATFLKDGDAIIIDLQGNGGGESDAADYFLKHIISLGGSTDQSKPIYILVDRLVGSAAEAVSYDAKLRKTAVIVGTRTYGAANNNRRFAIAPGFILSLSYHKPIHPLSGTNWEGTGVTPDIEMRPDLAIYVAQEEAIRRLDAELVTASSIKQEYAWRLKWLEAKRRPVEPDEKALRELAGQYGPIELRYEANSLRLFRSDRPTWPQGAQLSLMTSDGVFAIEGTDDVRLKIDRGKVQILRPSDSSETYVANP